MDAEPKVVYEFGPFRVDPDRQILLRDDQPVAITPKAFETLLILVRHSREVVSKDELMKAVWPSAFVEESNLSQNIVVLRKALGDTPEDRRYIATLPGRGYRFAADVRTVVKNGENASAKGYSDSQAAAPAASAPAERLHDLATSPPRTVSRRFLLALPIGAALALLVLGAASFFRSRPPTAAVTAYPVLVADFANTTGDPVFDGTLRQGLAVQLEQSPYFNLISDSQIAETLRLMEQHDGSRLTDDLARQLCQRLGATAVIGGSIASLGPQYVLGLSAIQCSSGEILTEEQVTADSKSQVLSALAQGASELRGKLGESLSSIQQYNVPLEQATTSSLDALQAYTLGRKEMLVQTDNVGAIPFFERAIGLDSNFAMAHARLGTCYGNLGERVKAIEETTKAYQLVDRTSGLEKLYITSHYHMFVTGDLLKTSQALELGTQIYPQAETTYIALGAIYRTLGEYDKALSAAQSGLRINPESGFSHEGLASDYLCLDRLDEAKAVIQESHVLGLDPVGEHQTLYDIGFLQHDAAAMAKEVAWTAGKMQYEHQYLFMESLTAASSGLLEHSRDLADQAVTSAQDLGWRENAARYRANEALLQALFGNAAQAQSDARAALGISRAAEVEPDAALAYVLSADTGQAESLADDLAKRFPDDTLVQYVDLPELRAEIEMARGNPAQAIQLLEASAPYEFGIGTLGIGPQCLPTFIRGRAYLAARDGASAAAEFQKILDHPGVVVNSPLGSLAHLELGRAEALEGDTAKARVAYKDFFSLWQQADSDIPILKQAKAEYAKLEQ
jgi:DNA-binding winged helix-turn-helix (wHTH) protein/tetratricopeptide (TPR) repeat protein